MATSAIDVKLNLDTKPMIRALERLASAAERAIKVAKKVADEAENLAKVTEEE